MPRTKRHNHQLSNRRIRRILKDTEVMTVVSGNMLGAIGYGSGLHKHDVVEPVKDDQKPNDPDALNRAFALPAGAQDPYAALAEKWGVERSVAKLRAYQIMFGLTDAIRDARMSPEHDHLNALMDDEEAA